MVALPSLPQSWTVEQYLDMERTSEVRHEYLDGLVYALAGGTGIHSVIAINVAAGLHAALRDGPCRVYSADMKVRVAATQFVYPDASVGCAGVERNDRGDEWLTAPRLVVEVLSKSTAAYDRGAKAALYRQVAALRDYMLVDTTRPLVEVYSCGEDGAWTSRTYEPGDWVEAPGLGARLAVDEIYAKVDLEAPD
ncbi:MAG: Uma2 family endonuclease [Chloroflexi bacterium]|nr:Uma2 family endonuclease [Chloroflexota bacterium]